MLFRSKPLSATGSSTLQLSSSRVKLSSHIVCDSDDYLDRDIDEIADAMAIESKPSTSGATQPTLSDMMDLLQAAADYIRFYITKIVLNKILKRLRSIRS